jgi:hypothetical protein
MNLLLLAPDIQEQLLFLPPIVSGKDRLTERHIRPIVAQIDWKTQRKLWRQLNL